MTRKKVNIKPRSELKRVEEKIDEWVLSSPNELQNSNIQNLQPAENKEDFFRFTFHMPIMLHNKIIEILEKEFS